MKDARLVAGVDCSTQATKVLVVDPESGAVVASGHAPHTVTGVGGARETDPREWWAALRDALAATGHAADIGAISVGGQQHGLVTLGPDGAPLRNAMLWNDTRAASDADLLIERLGAETWASRTGLRPVSSFTVSKWAWLRRNEPDLSARTAAIRLPHDYVTERLSGRGVTDRGDASGTGWWSPRDDGYAPDILGLAEIDLAVERLPTVLRPTEAAGEVPRPVADELGLRADVTVGPGTGDNMGAALGLGLAPGRPVVSLGTSGTVYAVATVPAADATGTVAGFADATGRFLPLAATLNCTLAVDRVAAWLGLDRDDVAPADGVVVLPYLDGERTPNLPGAAGLVTGLRHTTTPQQLLMAAYEGAAASLLGALDAIGREAGGLDPAAPLLLIGGGAKGRTWREVVRRLSGRPIAVPAADELVARGAAVQAAAVGGGESLEAVTVRWQVAMDTELDPVPADTERLAEIGAMLEVMTSTPRLRGRA